LSLVLPHALIDSLQGKTGFDEATFIQAHTIAEKVTSIRFNPIKYTIYKEQNPNDNLQLPIANTVPWCPYGQYLSERPSFTFDPLFHAGLYYVQEASSMFLWKTLQQTIGDNTSGLRVMDL
jgi:16S rRNA C967 or C1407 C5-methylase (RsmB/RsmF family)